MSIVPRTGPSKGAMGASEVLGSRSILAPLVAAVVAASTCVAGTNPVVFVTSLTGTGNLAIWSGAGGATGLAAGDAICRSRAIAAGLDNPQSFVAWLSDTRDDAYCRVHGLGGKRADRCGQAQLPQWAGPWVRTDGHPFGAGIAGMLYSGGQIFVPLKVDEFGASFSGRHAFTGTGEDGALRLVSGTASPCGDWTSQTHQLATVGDPFSTTRSWTYTGSGFCEFERPLLCFEVGTGPELTPPPRAGAQAFLAVGVGDGNLGGLSGADAICSSRAAAAGLPTADSFLAWLSDGATPAASRFTWSGPWIRIDGVVVAESGAELTASDLFAPLNVSEYGSYHANFGTWTGTLADGTAGLDTCQDWTTDDAPEFGVIGQANTTDDDWTEFVGGAESCSVPFGLYCFGQVNAGVIFADGFESGDTSAW